MTTAARELLDRLADEYAACASRLQAKALAYAVTDRFEEVIICQSASRTAAFIAACFSDDDPG